MENQQRREEFREEFGGALSKVGSRVGESFGEGLSRVGSVGGGLVRGGSLREGRIGLGGDRTPRVTYMDVAAKGKRRKSECIVS